MACATVNRLGCKQIADAPAVKRTRVVKVSAVKDSLKPSAAFAAAAAAVLLVSSPAIAVPVAPSLNPVSEIAAGPATKAKQAAHKLSGQGALAPDVEGQVRAGDASKPHAARQQKVSPTEAAALLRSGGKYLDDPEEFSGGHAEGAFNIPLMFKSPQGMTPNPDFEQQVKETFPDKQQQLVVGCKTGTRSAKAYQLLSKDYVNLIDNATGWDGWVEAKLPVSK